MTVVYTFEKGGQKTGLLKGEKNIFSPFFKSQTVNDQKFGIWFLVLCTWFQYIQWIEH